ncbi:unnamed protein product [Alopecurus aequalis]
MMNGGVGDLACLDRLRSRDIKGKNKEEDKRKMDDYEEEEDEDDGEDEEEEEEDQDNDDEEERRMWDGDKEKKWKEDVDVLHEKAKNKGEKRIHGGDDKTKYRKASTTTSDREKNNKSGSHGREHKFQIGDHDKDKRRSTLPPLDKNKHSLKEKSRKMPSTNSAEKKLHSCDFDHYKDKRKSVHRNCKCCEKHKKKKKVLGSHNGENKIRTYDHGQNKGRSKPHPFNNNEMQKTEMKKKKNTPFNLSKENKTQMTIDSKKENKRKKTAETFDKRKKMRTEDNDENTWSGDRWNTKNTMQGYNKEQKVQSGRKEQRNVPFTFIKLVYNNNFKEFLSIPPVVEPKLKDFTNRRVSLKDSEGKFSSVRLSVVDGSLAFYEGWNSFVSDHSIRLGDVLLFEYTARLHFSVRVFGMDSCERVCSSVEMQGGKKQKGCHPPDEIENAAKSMNAVSGARHVAVNSKEDPNRAVSLVEHGSSIALSDEDGYLANAKDTANAIIQTWTKGIRSSEIILIADDEAPLAQENEDTEKLKTLHAASEMHYVTANTEEDPKGVVSGALCGPSVALDNTEGTLAIGECKTNSISSVCSTEKTIRSEIIPVTDASPLAQENDDAVEVTTFPPHIEDTSMMKGSEPEIATPTKCTEIQDSDEDLGRKQEGKAVQLECTTALEKSPNNSKMNANGNVCSKYEAPGGSASLEKWEKATVSAREALDGTVPIKPEKLLKTEEKSVHNFSSVGGNSFEQSLQGGSPSLEKWKKVTVSGRAAIDGTVLIKPEKRPKTEEGLVHNFSSVGVNSFEQSLEKWKKTIGSGRAALDGTGLIKSEKLLKTEDRLVSNCSSMGVNSFKQSLQGYAGRAALDGTGLIRPEKQLKTDDKLVGNCSATGVNPVEQSSRGYAGTHSCLQQTPGKISKSTHIKTEIDLLVNEKGPTVQPKTQMEQFEPMGSISCRQQLNNSPVCANHAVARPSEHHSVNQEDRKDSHHVGPAVLVPVKVEVLELDNHSVLKTNLQFCVPSTTQTWLELPSSLPNALRRKGRLDRNVVMLKDPVKRLWPVFYHENSVFVGFTRGWKSFVAANNLQTGDICMLLKDLDEDELVYHVQITRK